jgi:hypothetical protein
MMKYFSTIGLCLVHAASLQSSSTPFRFQRNSHLFLSGGASENFVQMYKLTYFDAKGAAEIARIMMNLAQVPFIDERLPIHVTDGSYLINEK